MLLMLYWLVAAVALRVIGARRPQWLGRAALGLVMVGLAAFYGVIRVSWTVQVHALTTGLFVAVQLLAACWAVRCGTARDQGTSGSPKTALDTFGWLWMFLAASQVEGVQSEGADVLPQLACLAIVAVAGGWAFRTARPGVAQAGAGSAWALQAAWMAWGQPSALFIPQRTGAWLDVIEVHLPAVRPGLFASLTLAALGLRWVLARIGRGQRGHRRPGRSRMSLVASSWASASHGARALCRSVAGAAARLANSRGRKTHPAAPNGRGARAAARPSRSRAGGALIGLLSLALVVGVGVLGLCGERWLPPSWRWPVGTVITARELAALLPEDARNGEVAYAPALPLMPCRRIRPPRPAWLYFSNNPECVPDATAGRSRRVLARNPVPAGEGRILVSHWLPSPRFRSLVLEYANPGPAPCRLEVRRMVDGRGADAVGRLLECGVGLFEQFTRTDERRVQVVPPGGVWRQRFDARQGSLMVMGEVACSAPLVVTTGVTTADEVGVAGDGPAWEEPAEALRGGQTRGVFASPDEVVEATVDPPGSNPQDGVASPGRAAGIQRVTLGVEPLRGWDASDGPPRRAVLHGRYGGFTRIRLRGRPGGAGARTLLVLMPSGGWAGALYGGHARAIGSWRGLVLANEPATAPLRLDYDFTLPANSSAPVHLLAIPVR